MHSPNHVVCCIENSYILNERALPALSMLESMFYKIMQRIEGKQKEALKWTGRICPKIKKKLQKFIEWSCECKVKPGGNYKYNVRSHEMERDYCVDMKARTCGGNSQVFHATM